MVGKTHVLERSAIHRRRCVACGYDGGQLRDGAAPRCARCGCDLRVRPARSYAEMEGLGQAPVLLAPGRAPATSREQRVLQRWLAFAFLVMLGFMVLLHLVAALVR